MKISSWRPDSANTSSWIDGLRQQGCEVVSARPAPTAARASSRWGPPGCPPGCASSSAQRRSGPDRTLPARPGHRYPSPATATSGADRLPSPGDRRQNERITYMRHPSCAATALAASPAGGGRRRLFQRLGGNLRDGLLRFAPTRQDPGVAPRRRPLRLLADLAARSYSAPNPLFVSPAPWRRNTGSTSSSGRSSCSSRAARGAAGDHRRRLERGRLEDFAKDLGLEGKSPSLAACLAARWRRGWRRPRSTSP